MSMNDDLLYSLQRSPDPAFARTLGDRLHARASAERSRLAWPGRRSLFAIAAAIIVAVAFAFPAVRASAESFLALFRVTRVIGVRLADRNVAGMVQPQLDLPHLIDQHVQTILDPGPPIDLLSVGDASSAAGYTVAQPTIVPDGALLDRIRMQGPRAVRVIVDVDPINEALRALGIRDVELPRELDGGIGFIRTRAIVALTYQYRKTQLTLFQTPMPEMTMPAGVDLARLGEIALRIAGLSANDARQMAQRMDWRSTLLVPVPPAATSFRQVDIDGREGVLVESKAHAPYRSLVLWPGRDRVFALEGPMESTALLQMAQSIR